MKTSSGFDQCYNGQIAVDETTQIVATGLTRRGGQWGLCAITRAQAPLRRAVLADAGYRGEAISDPGGASRLTFRWGMKGARQGAEPGPRRLPAHGRQTQRCGRASTADAKRSSSPCHGQEVLGFRRQSPRRRQGARQWNVVCLAVNLNAYIGRHGVARSNAALVVLAGTDQMMAPLLATRPACRRYRGWSLLPRRLRCLA